MTAATIDWPTLSAALDHWLDADEFDRGTLLAAWERDDPALAGEVRQAAGRLLATEQRAFMARPARAPAKAAAASPSGAASSDPPAGASKPAFAGQRCGPYRLLAEIGRGGMSEVWLAERDDGRYEGRVAVKLLRPDLAGHAQSGRFLREGRILARLDHPSIARLLDAGLAEGGPAYWVLEHVDGLPLDRHCDEHGLDLAARLALFAEVADAVAHAHGRLILHRDLKPSNILVDRAGRVKLLDFGIAKLLDEAFAADTQLTRDHGAAYTPLHAAPEQLASGELTTATDTYALGLLLYALVTGVDAFQLARHSLHARLAAMRAGPPSASQVLTTHDDAPSARRAREVRGDIDLVIAKSLALEPACRYQSAADLADDIRRHLRREPIRARRASAAHRLRLFVGRHWLLVSAAGVGATALAVASGVALLQAREADRRREQTENLIGFMMNDLRESLAASGRLEMLASTSEQVLAHYAAEDPRAASRIGLANRSSALYEIGSLAISRARADTARAAFVQMQGIDMALAARWPESVETVAAAARTASLDGNLASESERTDDRRRAEASYRTSARLAGVTYERDGRSDAAAALAGSLIGDLGLFLSETGRPDEALDWLTRAETLLRQAAPTHAQARRDLVNAISVHTDALFRLGRYEDCIAEAGPLLALETRRSDGTRDLGLEEMRNGGLNRLVSCDLNRGRTTDAVAASRLVVKSTQALAQLDPTNVSLSQRDRAQRLLLVEALVLADDKVAAATLFDELDRDLRPQLASTAGQDEGLKGNWLRGWTIAAARVGVSWERFQGPWKAFLSARERHFAGGSEDGRYGTGPPIQGGTRMLVALRAAGRLAEARRLEAQLTELVRITPAATDLRARLARAEFASQTGYWKKARAEVSRLLELGMCHPDLVALQGSLDRAGRDPSLFASGADAHAAAMPVVPLTPRSATAAPGCPPLLAAPRLARSPGDATARRPAAARSAPS